MPTKILPCKCSNAFQDERYGRGMRVMNKTAAKNVDEYRCTVCLSHVQTGEAVKQPKKKEAKA